MHQRADHQLFAELMLRGEGERIDAAERPVRLRFNRRSARPRQSDPPPAEEAPRAQMLQPLRMLRDHDGPRPIRMIGARAPRGNRLLDGRQIGDAHCRGPAHRLFRSPPAPTGRPQHRDLRALWPRRSGRRTNGRHARARLRRGDARPSRPPPDHPLVRPQTAIPSSRPAARQCAARSASHPEGGEAKRSTAPRAVDGASTALS